MSRSIMRTVGRATAAAVVATTGAVGVAAAPASAAGCHYRVVWNVAGVYAEPHQQDRYLLKTKQRGDVVGDECTYTISDGYEWQLVDVAGHIGFMRADSVVRIS